MGHSILMIPNQSNTRNIGSNSFLNKGLVSQSGEHSTKICHKISPFWQDFPTLAKCNFGQGKDFSDISLKHCLQQPQLIIQSYNGSLGKKLNFVLFVLAHPPSVAFWAKLEPRWPIEVAAQLFSKIEEKMSSNERISLELSYWHKKYIIGFVRRRRFFWY